MRISPCPLFLLILLFTQCGTSQGELDLLTSEVETLKKDLEDCQYGASRLLGEAKAFRQSREFERSKERLDQLITRHQGSAEYNEAQQLLASIEEDIEKAEAAEAKEREKAAADEKQRLANATAKMRKKHDDIQNVTFYYDKSSPQYTNYNGFFCYISQSQGSRPGLRLRIQYAADDWLFIESYTIKVDGATYEITEDHYGEIETDNGEGGIWEWLDRPAEGDEFEMIKAVANGKDTKIRFSGRQYHKDKSITSEQRQALRNVLDAYEALGGRL